MLPPTLSNYPPLHLTLNSPPSSLLSLKHSHSINPPTLAALSLSSSLPSALPYTRSPPSLQEGTTRSFLMRPLLHGEARSTAATVNKTSQSSTRHCRRQYYCNIQNGSFCDEMRHQRKKIYSFPLNKDEKEQLYALSYAPNEFHMFHQLPHDLILCTSNTVTGE